MARKILQLIKNPPLRERLGSKGKEILLENNDWRMVSAKIESVYESVIHSAGS